MSPARFERDTAVHLLDPVAPRGAGTGTGTDILRTRRYSADIDGTWWIVAGPNGGYIGAIVARAVMDAAGSERRRLRTLHLQYLRRPVEGPCEVAVEVIRHGRSVSFARASMQQDGHELVTAAASLAEGFEAPSFDEGDGSDFDGWTAADGIPADIPTGPIEIPLHRQFDYRPHVSGSMRVGGWIRFRESGVLDECALVAMTDAWWPPVIAEMHRFDRPMAVPTIDLTVHLRLRPPADTEWVQAIYSSPLADDGYLTEHARLRVPGTGLVAESTQLAILR